MKFVLKLSEAELETLKELMRKHNNYRARIRAHAILLSHAGYKRKEIRRICFVKDVDTISSWFDRWESMGLVGVFDDERSGRPELLQTEEKVTVIKEVRKFPNSLRTAQSYLCEKLKKSFSIDTLKRLLKFNNFSWRRIKKSLKSKRDEEKFKQAKVEISALKKRHRAGEIDLRYFDESGFDLQPTVPYAWQLKGKTIELPSARSSRVTVLGFLNLDCDLDSYGYCNYTGKFAG